MDGLCLTFGKRARTETLSSEGIDLVFSGALTDPTDSYGY